MQLLKKVPVGKLVQGMSLAEILYGKNGAVLVPEGYKITNLKIFRNILRNNDIDSVRVYCDPYMYASPEQDTPDQEPVHGFQGQDIFKRIEEKYSEEKDQLVKDFHDLLENKKISRPVLDKHFDRTMQLLRMCSNVFQLIGVFNHLDKSVYTYGYNLALLAYKIGIWCKLSPPDLKDLFLAALLADVGKVKVDGPEDKEHVIVSYKAVKDYSFISDQVKHSILMHHERKNGSGYPFKRMNHEIFLYARVISVADTYNKLIQCNPNPLDVIKKMQSDYINLLDENILYTLYNSVYSSFVGQIVKLSDGEVGEIIFIDHRNIFRPIIKTILGKFINLADPQHNNLVISEFIISNNPYH